MAVVVKNQGWAKVARALAVTACLAATGCGDDVQGDLQLFLSAPAYGRNPIQDPFAFVNRIEASLVDDALQLSSLGSSTAVSKRRVDLGLSGGGGSGTFMLLGLNEYDRKVSHGFGPMLEFKSGIDLAFTVQFTQYSAAVAHKFPLDPGMALADRFRGVPATVYLDGGDLESGKGGSAEDLSALATLLWNEDMFGGPGGELMVQVQIRDGQSILSGDSNPAHGDAVRLYLDERDQGVSQVITVGRSGVYESTGSIQPPEVGETGYGTWEVRFVVPLTLASKTAQPYFDLTVFDFDEGEDPDRASWQFDGARIEEDLLPEEFGRLVLGVPILSIVPEKRELSVFPSPNGDVRLSGQWDENSLNLEVFVPDGNVQTAGSGGTDLSGTDRVAVLFDLNNGLWQPVEEDRFVGISVNAGDQKVYGAGPDPANLVAAAFEFTGTAQGIPESGGYRVSLAVPWNNLGIQPGEVKYLGMEVRVLDEANLVTAYLSGAPEWKPEIWPVLKMAEKE